MTSWPTLFAQQAQPARPAAFAMEDLMIPVAVMAGLLLLLSLVVNWMMRWYRDNQKESRDADLALMEALREAADDDELSDEEFERAQAVLERRARGEPPIRHSPNLPDEPPAESAESDRAPTDPVS